MREHAEIVVNRRPTKRRPVQYGVAGAQLFTCAVTIWDFRRELEQRLGKANREERKEAVQAIVHSCARVGCRPAESSRRWRGVAPRGADIKTAAPRKRDLRVPASSRGFGLRCWREGGFGMRAARMVLRRRLAPFRSATRERTRNPREGHDLILSRRHHVSARSRATIARPRRSSASHERLGDFFFFSTHLNASAPRANEGNSPRRATSRARLPAINKRGARGTGQSKLV